MRPLDFLHHLLSETPPPQQKKSTKEKEDILSFLTEKIMDRARNLARPPPILH